MKGIGVKVPKVSVTKPKKMVMPKAKMPKSKVVKSVVLKNPMNAAMKKVKLPGGF